MKESRTPAILGRLRLFLAALPVMFGPGCQQEEPNAPANVVAEAPTPAKVVGSPAAPPAPAPATDPALFGGAAARSRLIVDRGGGRGLVALGEPESDDNAGPADLHKNGILSRELIRQAMLIAARDELGLATRDAVLGEAIPDAPGDRSIRLGSFMSSGTNRAFVIRGDGAAERLLVADLPCPYAPKGSLAKLVAKAEALSRTEFPGLLRKLGAVGKPNERRADAKVPAGVEDRLGPLGLTGPFAAARLLHEAIRADGESPDRLAALARAYAMLGVQSELQWHPAHKAYKARALLYAQRLAAREPKSARALWHRAYVEAMVGMHRDAITDFAAAATADGASSRPDWVDLIDGLAHQDLRKLEAAEGAQARLAAFLKLLAVEFPTGARSVIESARRVAERDPECFRAYEAMCRVPGVANGHTATVLGPQAFAEVLPRSLKAMPGLPERVRAFLDHPAGGDPALYEAFEKSAAPGDDPGEPSWAAMGHLLRETRFTQVFSRLRFMRTDWSVPYDEFWNESRLSVVGHRFYPFLEMVATSPRGQVRANPDFLGRLLRLDLEPTEFTMFVYLQRTRARNAMRAHFTSSLHLDEVARDLAADIQLAPPDQKVRSARRLLEVSPDCAYAMAALIEHDPKAKAEEIAAWEKKAGDAPVFLEALARLHTRQKKPELAERDLIRYIELDPACWAYQMLAANYKDRGDMRRWRETLEKSLTTEETGLEHVQAQVQIADYLMDQGKWEEAKEYAEAAGESWAAWAMECAQRCAEGMKDWPRAELWARRQSERYANSPGSLFRWYLFCVKTGRGDIEAARAFADEAIGDLGGLENLHPDFRGYYQWMSGDLKAALGSFRVLYGQDPSFATCLPVIAVAGRLGDRETANRYRKILIDKHRQEARALVRIAELLPEALKGGKSRPPDLTAVNQVLESMPAWQRPHGEVWLGIFLAANGQPDAARPFLERSLTSSAIPEWRRAIAGQALRVGRR